MEERFLYEVRPVRPMMINGRRTRRACSLNLTKEEVKEYLASANIYRRFGATDVIKVTGANLDQLHVSKDKAAGIINGTVPVSKPVENKVPEKIESDSENKKVSAPNEVESTSLENEEASEEDNTDSTEEEEKVEQLHDASDDNGSIADTIPEEIKEEETVTESTPVKTNNVQDRAKVVRPNYNQQNNRKKKNKNHR